MAMKRIHKGSIFEVIPEANGMVFAFKVPERENAPVKSGEIPLDFNYYNYTTGKSERVKKDIYQLAKFGANYQKIVNTCENYVLARSVLLPEGRVLLVDTDGTATFFDGKGEVIKTGMIKYRTKVPYALSLGKDGLWGSFPESDSLVRFNLDTLKSELRIGKKGDCFARPMGIVAAGNSLYISSSENNKLIKLDINSFETEDIYGFKEKIISYVTTGKREFVSLESGLYEI